MSTGTQLATALAPAIGMTAATLERHLYELARAGLIRRSGKGGGKAAVHLEPLEYAEILLSLAAINSTGAAEAAQSIGQLFSGRIAGAASLRTQLAATIAAFATQIKHGAVQETPAWELTLCLNPLKAWMTWPEGQELKRFYWPDGIEPPPAASPPFRRETILTEPLLRLVANLSAK